MTKGLEDEDHIYILNELGRFFNDNKSLKNFTNMGDNWKDSAAEIHSYPEQQKLKTETLNTITSAYIQEEKDNSLQMTHKTKHHVELFTKGDRAEELAQMLNSKKIVTSKYFVDNNKNNAFEIEVDFKGLSIKCSTKIEITKGKAQAQTTALLKLLENNAGYMEGIYINAFYQRNKSTSTAGASLSELLDERNDITNTQYKILDKNLGDTIKYFEIYTKDIIGKRFHGNKTFIDDLESFSERFLNQVIAYIY
jgi:mannitol/fructose-specific phosphotransferase system IIA component